MPSTTTTAAAAATTLDLTGCGASSSAKAAEDLDIYDEIEIEDMTYDATLQIYHYPCPCGDRFEISIDSLREGEDIAVCPSCSLMVRVIFDLEDLEGAEKEEN
ncbi:dimethylaniline monooxygenase (N-oxide forming) [Cladophialophora psammophila CBS 110553]|uniref:Diphthamide biosynthesis protein 3 n=1 Tax=Cladophialophora psammophila CBS 110553 TaxID=1182543 RepID=W9X2X3_9EURO|nr:dimethylaniline monooxygenase (N-oxide forming) [Cladophialophora psammophila CBS 110553]EXJ74538.1 dimethylaniline monooxygenase (N-oxide forming) [Cladophialophora psammophila CBS 110553]